MVPPDKAAPPAQHSGTPRGLGRAASCGTAAMALLLAGGLQAATDRDQWLVPDESTYPAQPATTGVQGTGDLTVHASRAALIGAAGGMDLVHEDFSSGFIFGPEVGSCFQAVGSHSDDPCFAPGDLAPGFAIRSSRGSIFDANLFDSDVAVLGSGVLNTPGPVIGANISDPPWNPTHINFDPPRTLVGMDAYDGMQAGVVRISAFDADGLLIGSFEVDPPQTNQAAFAGFTSTRPVHRVEINALESGGAELIGALVFGGSDGVAAANPSALEFGAIAVGGTGHAVVTLDNHGQLPLHLANAEPPSASFVLVEDACSGISLAPAGTCEMAYAFTPPHAGRFEGTAILPDGAALPLSGVGVDAWISASPGHLQFPEVSVGASANATLVLRNPGSATQAVSAIASSSAVFSAAGGDCGAPPFELQAGGSCELVVAFAPQRPGRVDARLTISSVGATLAEASMAASATAGVQ